MTPIPGTALNETPGVSSFNEWALLEEVILGVPDGAAVPPWHQMIRETMPEEQMPFFRQHGGKPFPQNVVDDAKRDIDRLARLLEREGVVVRFPDVGDHGKSFATPDWGSSSGLYAAMPRDLLLVVGTEIIEAPLAWRCRFFEVHAYRNLLKEYFRRGAKWTSAPRPTLRDEQYRPDGIQRHSSPFVITEYEPTFDAADFIRCGRDLFVQRSHVTNAFGIDWLRRHLAPTYAIHEIEVEDAHPMHIDATLLPLSAGKAIANPERLPVIPAQFKNWEVKYAPPPSRSWQEPLYMSSRWISMNVLSLDEKRILVEEQEKDLIAFLRDWGFEPIPCKFRGFNALGGSFHCATLDVRRQGELESYF
jgi:glycine amidinotransferase